MLLRAELYSSKWQPTVLMFSGVTDCYQPIERQLKVTRRCLEVLAEFRNPVGIVTKSHLVTRDIDVLQQLAACDGAMVFISVTTLDAELSGKMEPRAAKAPQRRLAAIRPAAFAKAGTSPSACWWRPVVPGLTDHEIPEILQAAADAGAKRAGYVTLRLPFAVAGLFEDWVAAHYPDRASKILNRVRDIRGGKLNDPNFGSRDAARAGGFCRAVFGDVQAARRRVGLDAGAVFQISPCRPSGGQYGRGISCRCFDGKSAAGALTSGCSNDEEPTACGGTGGA